MKFKPTKELVVINFTEEQELIFENFLTQIYVFLIEICEKKINPFIKEKYFFQKGIAPYLNSSMEIRWDMINYCDYRKKLDPDGEYDSTMGVYLSVSVIGDNIREMFPTIYTCKMLVSLRETELYSEFEIDFSNVKELEKKFEMYFQKTVEFINNSVDHIIYDINNNWKIEE